MPDHLHPAERLLNLVIALVNTAGRLTKEQIRTTVAGYADASTPDAFERMFERDKDTLRELGIPILTVAGSGHSDDVGYRIDQEAYALRAVELTAAELGVLSLAAGFWQDKSLRTDAQRALTKLRAVAAEPGGTDLVAGLAPRVRAAGEAFGPLLDAVQARQAVRFTYRAANTGEVGERTVEPWRLLARGGGWYVVGRDRDRDAPRSFRLSRLEGAVRPVGAPGSYAIPTDLDAAAVLSGRPADPVRIATLALRPERASALRARAVSSEPTATATAPTATAPTALATETAADAIGLAPEARATALADRDVVQIPFTSTTDLADEVAGYADAVVVLAPHDLRAAVLQRLRAAAALDVAALDVAAPDSAVPDTAALALPAPLETPETGDARG
ncbi:helix-turn-helix transcriptional regulator [Pengzhenrongella frigida]|uniref:WYL domain-containing protein n=1 Tax=Pengzhenrongella frigida TaxID=1259133 RepID=A0A4Q5MYD3_9MICO|nr:WYL domain-containing protein [Cellulomonas sp. HLT2-17]RYV50690.1 WYL domain-containing protein [Cellulomonas sp. HLT2-17]